MLRPAHTVVPNVELPSFIEHDPHEINEVVFQRWLDDEIPARAIISSDLIIQWMSRRMANFVKERRIPVHFDHLIAPTVGVSKFLASTGEVAGCTTFQDLHEQEWVIWAQRLTGQRDGLIGLAFYPPKQWYSFTALAANYKLTPMEGRVIELVLNGRDTGRIAQILSVSKQTLKSHIKHSYCKLDVANRGDLFALAGGFGRPSLIGSGTDSRQA